MATKLTKDLMKPGVYRKGSTLVPITGERLSSWDVGQKQLRDAGYRVPVWMEHTAIDDHERGYPVKNPVKIAAIEKSPMFVGWLDDINYDQSKNLAMHTLNALSDDTAAKMQETGVGVSPQFGPWKDDDGNTWNDVVHHVALTMKPVNPDQSLKFTPAQFSQMLTGMLAGEPNQVHRFSIDEEISPELLLQQIQQFNYSGGMFPQQQPQQPQQPSMGGVTPPAGPQGQPGGYPSNDPKSQLMAGLNALGINVNPGSPVLNNPEALAEMLQVASRHAGEQAGMMGTQGAAGQPGQPGQPANQRPQEDDLTMPMSEAEAKVLTEKVTQLSEANTAAVEENKALKSQVRGLMVNQFSRDVEDAKRRINALLASGRCDKPQHDAMLARLGGPAATGIVAIQFSDDNSHVSQFSDVAKEIAIYEKLPEGTYWSAAERGQREHQYQLSQSPFYRSNDVAQEPTEAETETFLQAFGYGQKK